MFIYTAQEAENIVGINEIFHGPTDYLIVKNHVFKSDNMIVLYVGEDSAIIQALEELLGPQFAGYTE